MASEWTSVTLGEIAADGNRPFAMGPFGSNIRSENYRDTGVPVIRGTNLSVAGGSRFISDDFAYLSEDKADELRSSTALANDIVFVAQGTVGKVGIVPKSDKYDRYILSQNLMRVRLNERKANPLYVYYFFQSADGQQEILSRANPTGVPCISRPLESLRSFKVCLPSQVDEQKQIAHILGTLDDKIELNRKMNETLEAMVRALFKSWFVDFDPVRAKAEGRDPGRPAPIAALFPDSFEDSELGEIPAGWAVQSIYEIADVTYGAPFASSLFNSEKHGKPLLRIRDLRNETPSVWTPEEHPKGYLVKPGDIVVGMDGEFRAYIWGGDETWLNQRICVFVPKKFSGAAFVINSIHAPLAHIEATETATTVIHLGKSDIDRFHVTVPTKEVLSEFNKFCQPWYDQIICCKLQSRVLTSVRDSLLPKLISGELRVDAESA